MSRARAVLLFALAAACGGGSDTPTPPAPPPAIALAASPAQLTVVAGTTSAPVALTLGRTGAVAPDVQLAVEGAPPAGASVTLAAPTLSAPATTTSLTVTASAGAAPATGSFAVRATAGALSTTATIQVTIAPRPDFSVTLDSTITVPIAGSGQATLRLTRSGGYTAPVPLLASGLPPGATASFAPDTLTGAATTSTLTLTASPNVAPGRYPFNLLARGGGAPGVADRSLTAAMIVPAPQGAVDVRTELPQVVIPIGGTRTLRAFVRRSAPFAGPVTLSGSVPADLSIRVTPQPLPPGDTAATITIDVAAGAFTGTPFVSLVATGQGVAPDTARFAVAKLNIGGTYALILNNGGVPTLAAGRSLEVPVEVFRQPTFTAPVTVTPIAQPAGITLSFAPTTITGTTGSATITVAPGVAPGPYFVEWLQTVPGLPPSGVAARIEVTAPTAPTRSGARGGQRGAGTPR